ncbi:MAG: glutamate synthase (NADPH/NADH) large chain [Lentisphaeria bacterium]
MIAHLKGNVSHKLLKTGIEALTCMTHLGGIAAYGKTGDGCGLLIQKPDGFLRAIASSELQKKLSSIYGVGSVMLSQDEERCTIAKQVIGEELAREGLDDIVWRDVPTNSACL